MTTLAEEVSPFSSATLFQRVLLFVQLTLFSSSGFSMKKKKLGMNFLSSSF